MVGSACARKESCVIKVFYETTVPGNHLFLYLTSFHYIFYFNMYIHIYIYKSSEAPGSYEEDFRPTNRLRLNPSVSKLAKKSGI